MYEKPQYLPAGDRAMVVELGNAISPAINRRVRNLALAIDKAQVPGVFDIMPTYRSLLVYYDPLRISWHDLQQSLEGLQNHMNEQTLAQPRVVHVPTLYGGEHSPDIEFVAENAGLSVAEVVELHSGADYLVYMMGFSPGFPYLGGMSEKLVTPRLDTPRTEIPAGSVGIAESQTGVYPIASPGGWRLIGRTPLRLFDAGREPPALLSTGDYVRFVALESEEEYRDIERRVQEGSYEVVAEPAS